MDQETPSESPHRIMEPTRTLTLKMDSKQWEMEIPSKLDSRISTHFYQMLMDINIQKQEILWQEEIQPILKSELLHKMLTIQVEPFLSRLVTLCWMETMLMSLLDFFKILTFSQALSSQTLEDTMPPLLEI